MRSPVMFCYLGAMLLAATSLEAQNAVILEPERVFDGQQMHDGWLVLVQDGRIAAAGPGVVAPAGTETLSLPGTTLRPCLIEEAY